MEKPRKCHNHEAQPSREKSVNEENYGQAKSHILNHKEKNCNRGTALEQPSQCMRYALMAQNDNIK